MINQRVRGFTFIELLVFIVVTSMVMMVILLGATAALRQAPNAQFQWQALQTARGCMEYFLNQRRINGYSALSCPSSPSTTACAAPSGFSVSASVTCTSWSGDSSYKLISVSVSGLASATLAMQIGDYQ